MKHSNIVLTQYLSCTSICLFPEDTPITPFPPPYPWKIIVNCDEEGVLKTQIGKFQPNQGLGEWRALTKKKARGAIELQCSVTGKKLAGYNRFDHIHIECKQKLLVEIFGT